ncbi:sigma-54 interaction domain-containing protein [Thermodesulfobacteriota bacterium]
MNKLLQFEELISKLSAIFVNLPPDQVELEIEAGLKLIGEFLHAERCILIRNNNEGKQFDVSFSWLCKELDPCIDIFPHKPDSKLIQKLRNGEECVIRCVEDIPKECSDTWDYITTTGIKSSLILPLKVGGQFLGSIGIDFFSTEYHWPNGVVTKLKFIADVFSNAISRKINEEVLQNTLKELAIVKRQLEAECTYLQDEIKLEHNFEEIIGQSRELKKVLADVETVAPTDATVLIQGETGTGKELLARAIHNANPRKDRPMVKVNCAALPSSLIESELFGHVKGAFTGAQTKQIGRFELANGGTLFLDEISELPLELQPKLLRVLQEGEFERLGSPCSIKVDIRIIVATNRDLEKEVLNDRFRKDLWYRLNLFPITIPPLRERTDDIPPLVNWFVQKFNKKHAKSIRSISRNTMESLEKYPWPGNVRELQNVIERAIIIAKRNKLLVDLPKTSLLTNEDHNRLDDIERNHICKMLNKTKWRISGVNGAAIILGLHPNTLRWRMQKLSIEKPWK